MRALPPYGSSLRSTLSPTSTFILCKRILPARYASTEFPPSSVTLKSVFGSASSTTPCTSCASVSITGDVPYSNKLLKKGQRPRSLHPGHNLNFFRVVGETAVPERLDTCLSTAYSWRKRLNNTFKIVLFLAYEG